MGGSNAALRRRARIFRKSCESCACLVSLKPANEGAIQEIEKHATAVSDPNDAYYGKYLSMEEVNALRAPDPDARGRVLDFFAQYRHRD